MIHLAWDPVLALVMVLVGFLTGFVAGPAAWPVRQQARLRPPVMLAAILGYTNALAFFIPLAVFRIALGGTAELQATVLYLACFTPAGIAGLYVRARMIR